MQLRNSPRSRTTAVLKADSIFAPLTRVLLTLSVVNLTPNVSIIKLKFLDSLFCKIWLIMSFTAFLWWTFFYPSQEFADNAVVFMVGQTEVINFPMFCLQCFVMVPFKSILTRQGNVNPSTSLSYLTDSFRDNSVVASYCDALLVSLRI